MFRKTFVILVFVITIVDVTLAQGNRTIMAITRQAIDSCTQRQTDGFICVHNCEVLARCIQIGNLWETALLKSCDATQGLFCNEQIGDCSTDPGPCNPGGGPAGGFTCTSEGIFPDPGDCRRYHTCFTVSGQLVTFSIQCPLGSAFNPQLNDCSLDSNHDICRTAQFRCAAVGQMGAWPLNPNIFYICFSNNGRLFPVMYRCARGEIFGEDDMRCIESNWNLGNGGGGAFTCPSPGLFPDTSDCRSYFFCNADMRPQRITCPNGTYFDQVPRNCVIGVC